MSKKSKIIGTHWEPSNITGVEEKFLNIKEEDIVKAAVEDGNNNLPPADSKELFGIQQTIWQHTDAGCVEHLKVIENERKSAIRHLDTNCVIDEFDEPEEKDAKIKDAAERLEQLRDKFPEANGAYARLKNSEKGELVNSNRDAYSRLRELKSFKITNNLLERDAVYPDTKLPVIAVVVVALLAETIMNSAIFADVSGGLLAGAIQAFLFSLINVLLGAGFGYFCLRNWSHVRDNRRYGAIIGSVIIIVLAIFWNGAVAHFREIAATILDFDSLNQRVSGVISNLFSDPFGIGSIQSVGLFAIGIIIFCIVAYEFYCKLDDKYPGYGEVDREYRDKFNAFEECKQGIRESLEDMFEAQLEHVESIVADNDSKYHSAQVRVEKFGREMEDRRSSLGVLVNRANSMLGLYREKNSFVRDGTRAVHFDKLMKAEDYLPIEDAEKNNGDVDDETDPMLKPLKTRLDDIREDNKTAAKNASIYKGALLEFEALLSEDLEEFFQKIDKAVRHNFDEEKGDETITAVDIERMMV